MVLRPLLGPAVLRPASQHAVRRFPGTPMRAALFSTSRLQLQRVAALVVGAGPAGVATVGSLLDHLPSSPTVTWVDPDFAGGRISRRYREVPGNTRTKLFVDYARSSHALDHVIKTSPTPNPVTILESLPPNDTCSLGYAGDMVSMLIGGLAANPAIDCRQGRVTTAQWDAGSQEWSVTIDDPASNSSVTRQTPLLVYCTGASPTLVQLPAADSATFLPSPTSRPKLLELDTALKPSLLATSLFPASSTASSSAPQITVGVIGASHSAILVLMNLYNLAAHSPAHANLRVRWFSRVPADKSLKYAVYKDAGWILYDNTGLKGRAADFARENLDNQEVLARSPVGKIVERIDCSGGRDNEAAAFRKYLVGSTTGTHGGCDYVVQAVGFTTDPLPSMLQANSTSDKNIISPLFDHETGAFHNKNTGEVLPGLHGAGIAFPERVVDPEGNVEHAVGFYKFVKFLKRAVPQWVSAVYPNAACQENTIPGARVERAAANA
ncbi:pyridine nucleotide-disulfide oxidoreductase-domain-containing protein [Microdochium trichocladiopsis]|uniref:Pyridine nucleotide-disulfide oxidoreductase-domain-containing protein n=1 Tax=Microdochium trichocladiopsis TaxID=1682393 RepID=A0A9P8Y8B9_9PEZI|nr:pyridine nucleotide-disulfide oxidoreductase-domain-containing protein [Microdochium trichocladiopsis]KAH7033034.1 pyridine nucleotide-disulfide oxidoreductase-domain-containing protein [Microdochium trichocladiopsis]